LPPFDGSMAWYEDYATSTASDDVDGRLVSWHSFDRSWDSWEVHPHGHELVVCCAGVITVIQELLDGSIQTTTLEPGQVVMNEPGVWHTADVAQQASVLFITAGLGTSHRPR
jgi:hypothetical protein